MGEAAVTALEGEVQETLLLVVVVTDELLSNVAYGK
jgi:hypothetical protein